MRAFGVVMITVLLAACGQKGPLYMAPKEPAQAAPPAQETTPATSDDEDDGGKKDDNSEQD